LALLAGFINIGKGCFILRTCRKSSGLRILRAILTQLKSTAPFTISKTQAFSSTGGNKLQKASYIHSKPAVLLHTTSGSKAARTHWKPF
jgi:hypothetical protein